jgi:hypothetical protein
MKRIATAILVAVVLAGWGEPPYQGLWDVEPRLLGWWRALCTQVHRVGEFWQWQVATTCYLLLKRIEQARADAPPLHPLHPVPMP